MSRRIKGLPPRKVLQNRDNATGSYPTIVRTGDGKRTGKYNIFFDDNETIIFSNRNVSPFTTVEDPKTDFHQSPDFSGSLIAYWNFDDSTNTFGGASSYYIYHSDLYTGSLDLTSSVNSSSANQQSFLSAHVPPDLSVENSINYRYDLVPASSVGKKYKSWISGSQVDNFSFGNGTTDYPLGTSFWIKRNEAYDSADETGAAMTPVVIPQQYIMSKSGSVGAEWTIGLANNYSGSNGLLFSFCDNSTGAKLGKSFQYSSEDPNIPLGVWHHISVNYDGSKTFPGVTAYIDGETFYSSTIHIFSAGYTAMETTGQPFVIGAKDQNPITVSDATEEGPVGSYLADIAIFNRVITQLESRVIAAKKRGVNMPSGLPQNSKFLNSNNQTSLILTNDINRSIPNQFISLEQKVLDTRLGDLDELFTLDQKPFNEGFRPEQSRETNFYLTGTEAKNANGYFSSRLGSKLTLLKEFSNETKHTLPSLTASIHYFRPRLERFSDVTLEAQDPSTTPHNSWFYDAKLFGPLGNFCLTGAFDQIVGPPNKEYLFPDGLTGTEAQSGQLFPKVYKNHLLKSASYTATQGGVNPHYFEITELEHDFLLEKVVLQMPFSASSDWFNDKTYYVMADAIGIPGEDIGGPCITVALLREDTELDQRELICSGTIIPTGDNTSFIRTSNYFSRTVPSGFLSFSTPNVVLTPDGDGGFNGNITLEMIPAISNGFYAAKQNSVTQVIRQFSPLGRAGDTSDSGRSYFGKEYSTGHSLFSKNNIHYTFSPDVNVFMGGNSLVSPYMLKNDDKIVLAISKFRPVIGEGYVNSSRAVLATTHTVAIPTGQIKIRFYGSNIRNEKESNNDWYNQPLTSLAIHEDIHGDNPITDQFDVLPLANLSGTYVDNFITGTVNLQPGGNPYDAGLYGDDDGSFSGRVRGVVRSILGTNISNKTYTVTTNPTSPDGATRRYEVPHMIRNVSMYEKSSRFYDTYLPKFDDIYKMYSSGSKVYFDVGGFAEYAFSDSPDGSEIRDWIFQFPFEPKFSQVDRLSSFAKNVEAFVFSTPTKGEIVNHIQIEHGERELTTFTEHKGSSGNQKIPVEDRLSAAAVFGFHNGFGAGKYHAEWIPRQPLINESLPGRFLEIRGFKYGVYHIEPIGRRYTYRRDRFGQMRDMLEQSIDTKTVESTMNNFGTSINSIVSPIKVKISNTTQCSNLDTECSQSLPFFDGVARN